MEATWNSGWWDFHPLSEYPRKPVEWSNSSVIFTAHALQPLIIARHFSSSRQFSIPFPAPISSNLNAYDPPTIITCSPDDRWLFAFFPGRGEDGLCCLWHRGVELDNWSVKEWWLFAQSAGAVAARWLGGPREWTIDSSSGAPTRLPSRGPSTPVSNPTLVLVTQDHRLFVCYLRYYKPKLNMFSCSLLRPSVIVEQEPDNSQETLDDVDSVKICINAAIGTTYSDSSILVAMRSQVFPISFSVPTPDQFSLDLGLPLEMEPDQTEVYPTAREDSAEDSIIQIAEVQLQFDGTRMVLSSKVHPVIENAPNRLRDLCFVCKTPSNENLSSTSMHLVASFIDFKEYVSLPIFSMKCYSFIRTNASGGEKGTWTMQSEMTRDFEPGALAQVAVFQPAYTDHGIYVSIYDTSGMQPRHKIQQAELSVGHLKMLKIPDLTYDDTWGASPVLAPIRTLGTEVPINSIVSPGQNLLCTIFPSPWSSQMSIQKLPRPSSSNLASSSSSIPFLALSIVTAILSNRSTDDLTHSFLPSSTPLIEVAEVLHHVFTLLDRYVPGSFTLQLGITVESYRARTLRTSSNIHDRERADVIWRTAHDMISVATCNAVFNDCTDGQEYQTDLVWQMIDLSSWILGLVETIVKECILSSDFADSTESTGSSGDDLFGSDSPIKDTNLRSLDYPVFMHLVHIQALRNLRIALGHVNRFRKYLIGLTPRTENSQLSKEVLLDLVDYSGIDISGLDKIFQELENFVQKFDDDEMRKALASCSPSLSMQIPLREAVNSMSRSPALNKARLFIKSFEMIDGHNQTMSLDRLQKDKIKNRDVVSKGVLLYRAQGTECVRCGGRSEYGKDIMVSRPLNNWEKSWARRCICGGLWTRTLP
ncbi:hypothetical protein F5879DRAFT_999522 [Lentinula edodes]|uniref:uncharacterized protein n=1 Tax=Lentinula edodes TaxID=5353 RepID=UPI001E8CE690|nr:uncharacterized protein C8R40DRAFT_1120157 [Lentinula edodes]KAH7871762.1 hypothetical protein C8R40DRAFT_1120157 [Lentinula edodes]KAJ3907437.1 hypothetical protein F5879DRAFT_999522 [Lentinula edodes]